MAKKSRSAKISAQAPASSITSRVTSRAKFTLFTKSDLERIEQCQLVPLTRPVALEAIEAIGRMIELEDALRDVTGALTHVGFAMEASRIAIDSGFDDAIRIAAAKWMEHNVTYEKCCREIDKHLAEVWALLQLVQQRRQAS
jgi:hypothetical protein